MTYKQIEGLREARLWITQIITPAAAVIVAVPEARQWAGDKVAEVRRKIENRKKSKIKEI